MDVADVVNDHTEGERSLILLVGELISNLLSVGGLRGGDLALQELGVGIKSVDNVLLWIGEGEVVERGVGLVQVGHVDEVPVSLEGVALALNVVGESGALREWVVLLLNKIWVVDLERLELIESGSENIRVTLLKDGLSSSGDCTNKNWLAKRLRQTHKSQLYLRRMWAVPQKASTWAERAAQAARVAANDLIVEQL